MDHGVRLQGIRVRGDGQVELSGAEVELRGIRGRVLQSPEPCH